MLTTSPLLRLWHGLVTFGCAITIAEEEETEVQDLLTPALITASLTNDLFSFEKERGDSNVQNAVLVIMKEHSCTEQQAREICKERIRIEVTKYIRVVEETKARKDLSDDVKRYVEVMQYTLSGNAAWSTQCPRYNAGAKWNDLQLLRAEHGVEKYPATWPPKDTVNGDIKGPLREDGERLHSSVNGNDHHVGNGVVDHDLGHNAWITTNGHKRKRSGNSTGEDMVTNGIKGVRKSVQSQQWSKESLVAADVMALALDRNLPDLSDDVSRRTSPSLASLLLAEKD